jgi:hypothetical protein
MKRLLCFSAWVPKLGMDTDTKRMHRTCYALFAGKIEVRVL